MAIFENNVKHVHIGTFHTSNIFLFQPSRRSLILFCGWRSNQTVSDATEESYFEKNDLNVIMGQIEPMSFLMDAIISSSQTATFSVIVLSSFPPAPKFPFYCLSDIISQSSHRILVCIFSAQVYRPVCVAVWVPLCHCVLMVDLKTPFFSCHLIFTHMVP